MLTRTLVAFLVCSVLIHAAPTPQPEDVIAEAIHAAADVAAESLDTVDQAIKWGKRPSGGAMTFPDVMAVPSNRMPY
ncbi:hypothetical protein HGRIS_014150 [Hohenbuehelia grisea]|uniref:Uncharacterized protein n=1 Tax=Hohenbuehelia grisea TaxID=104357 RepID=A0ABR3JSN5_9AGAR